MRVDREGGLRILAVLRSLEETRVLEDVVDSMKGVDMEVRVEQLSRVPEMMASDESPDILICDLDMSNPSEFEALTRIIRKSDSAMAIIATAKEIEFNGIRHLMHLGAVDFIPQPMKRTDVLSALEAAINQLAHEKDRPVQIGKTITMLRSSGGVGATTIAVQMAADLVKRYQGAARSVCILDMDFQYGDAALSLDIQNSGGLYHILEADGRLDAAFLRGAMSRHKSNIDVLGVPKTIVPLEAMTPDMARKIIKVARQEYDYVIVDLPHAWTMWTSDVVGLSDVVVLTTNTTVASVFRGRRMISLLREQELLDVPVVVAVNRSGGLWSLFGHKQRSENALGHPIDVFIRDDTATVKAAHDRGVPVGDVKRKSKFIDDVHGLVDKIMEAYDLGGPLERANNRHQKDNP